MLLFQYLRFINIETSTITLSHFALLISPASCGGGGCFYSGFTPAYEESMKERGACCFRASFATPRTRWRGIAGSGSYA